MDTQLRTLTAFVEDPSLVYKLGDSQLPVSPVPGDPTTSSGFHRLHHTYGAHEFMYVYTHIPNNTK